jgi:hypothetical protein
VYQEYSDELLGQIMEQQKEDMDKYKQTESNIKLYERFQKSSDKTKFSKSELLDLYAMLNPVTNEVDKLAVNSEVGVPLLTANILYNYFSRPDQMKASAANSINITREQFFYVV